MEEPVDRQPGDIRVTEPVFKKNLSDYVYGTLAEGKSFIVMKDGKPYARLTPLKDYELPPDIDPDDAIPIDVLFPVTTSQE